MIIPIGKIKMMRLSLVYRRCCSTNYMAISVSVPLPRRLSSSNAIDISESKAVQIPEPTWSLKELELTSATETVSMEELERLTRKSLLDISQLDDPESLRRDLSNMLHCLEQVRNTNLPEMSDEDVYDVPRGVTAAPLRSSSDDAWKDTETDEAKNIWETLLKPKTIERGAHSYFLVETKRDDVSPPPGSDE